MAGGDSGDILQYRALKNIRSNPDWRYEGKSRTEIGNEIKSRSSILLSNQHTIPQESGRQIKFKVTDNDIEHLISDAKGRAIGTLYLSDIPILHRHFSQAVFIQRKRDVKNNNSGVHFYYYRINISGREMYLNIKEDRQKHRTTLHSITKSIKTEKD